MNRIWSKKGNYYLGIEQGLEALLDVLPSSPQEGFAILPNPSLPGFGTRLGFRLSQPGDLLDIYAEEVEVDGRRRWWWVSTVIYLTGVPGD